MKVNIKDIESEIVDQYLNDENPRSWIVGFSGGKDSTMLLQLVWFKYKKYLFQIHKHLLGFCQLLEFHPT